jgi:hypothetical protein
LGSAPAELLKYILLAQRIEDGNLVSRQDLVAQTFKKRSHSHSFRLALHLSCGLDVLSLDL